MSRGADHCERGSKGHLERTVQALRDAIDRDAAASLLANSDGILQQLDPRVKIIGMLALVLAATAAHSFLVIALIFGAALGLAVSSKVPIAFIAWRVWLGGLIFSTALALPALFLTPGPTLFALPLLGWEVTRSGLRSAGFLIARTETAATLALVFMSCTPWAHVLRGLRVLGVPATAVAILQMTHRYIFLLLKIAGDMFVARRSRTVGRATPKMRRQAVTSGGGVLLEKSLDLSEKVYSAMLSRGFSGEALLLDDFTMRGRDWWALAALIAFAGGAVWIGR